MNHKPTHYSASLSATQGLTFPLCRSLATRPRFNFRTDEPRLVTCRFCYRKLEPLARSMGKLADSLFNAQASKDWAEMTS